MSSHHFYAVGAIIMIGGLAACGIRTAARLGGGSQRLQGRGPSPAQTPSIPQPVI